MKILRYEILAFEVSKTATAVEIKTLKGKESQIVKKRLVVPYSKGENLSLKMCHLSVFHAFIHTCKVQRFVLNWSHFILKNPENWNKNNHSHNMMMLRRIVSVSDYQYCFYQLCVSKAVYTHSITVYPKQTKKIEMYHRYGKF